MSSEFNVEAAWKPYERLLSTPALASLIERPVRTLGEAPAAVLPSIVLAPDGLKLETLFVVTCSFISEVAINGSTFDLIDLRRVVVMRWWFGTAPLQAQPAAPPVTYETAVMELSHGFNSSSLNFVGESSEAWVKEVRRALPSTLVLNRTASL